MDDPYIIKYNISGICCSILFDDLTSAARLYMGLRQAPEITALVIMWGNSIICGKGS